MQCIDDLIQKLIQLDHDLARQPSGDDFQQSGTVSSTD